jgi:hypothetical protein
MAVATVASPLRPSRTDVACFAAAVAVAITWFFVYNTMRRDCLVDEPGHLGDIYHFLENKAGWPESMPMLPGYHFMVVSLWKLHPPLELLSLARLVTTGIALLGFTTFALAWRHVHGSPAGRATLLLALLPLTHPFTAMMYTDVPALAFTFCALWAHVTKRRAFAALLLAGSAGIRQTNLAWAGFFIAWEFLRVDEPRREFFQRARWMILLLVGAAIAIAVAGRLTLGQQHGNDFRLNLATVHSAGLLVLLLGLPLWLLHLPAACRAAREFFRARPLQACLFVIAGVIAAGICARSFTNPHIWNRELFWDGCTFTLLRNWPLVWIDSHPWLRVASGVNLVLMTGTIGFVFAQQRHRLELWLALACGMAQPLTNSLVEPRYFIPVVGFVLFFLEFSTATWRMLAIWWAVLSALHAPFVAKALSLW